MAFLRVVKWAEFQHYKDRDPVWIKLHRSVLDNYEWSRLQDASKSHLMGIWLLAARHDNQVPADPEWIGKRISATEPVDLQPLIAAGFIEVDGVVEHVASTSLASCSLEERRGEEKQINGSGDFTNPDHAEAAAGFVRAAKNPAAVKASIRAVAVGVPGHGPGFGWPVVGQALLELAAAGSPFSEQGLRAFARKVRDRKPERPKIELVTDDLGRNRPAIREGAGWKYLTDDEARAMGWTGSAA